MSSQTVKNKVVFIPYYESFQDETINFKALLIPFSKFGSSEKPSFIYNGNENISFQKRHPKYKRIFFDEFVD